MWIVERDKAIAMRTLVQRHEVGRYRWRWIAIIVAWANTHGHWSCYIRKEVKE